MTAELDRVRDESDRLLGTCVSDDARPAEVFWIVCSQHSGSAIERAKQVLLAYDLAILNLRVDDSEALRDALPRWFRELAAPDRTEEESAEYMKWWRGLSLEERDEVARSNRPWSLKAWLYQMAPERRRWFWFDASSDELSSERAKVEVIVEDWPYAQGALRWLLRCAGALSITCEDDDE